MALLLAFCTPLWAKVTATLERSQISEGETVQLILQRDSRGDGEAALEALNADFDVLGKSQSSSVRIVNGSISTERVLQITLAPKRTGTLTVPALEWAGERSQPLTLRVVAAGDRSAASGGPQVFLTTELDQAQPYVLSGVLLTVRIHTDQPLYRAGLELNGNADVLVQQVGDDTQTQEIRDGHTYTVLSRSYLLTPQRSGALTLDGPVLDAEIADKRRADRFGDGGRFEAFLRNSPLGGMVGATRPLHLRGKPVALDVRPRPAGAGALWVPARDVELSGEWSGDDVRAGEPVTLQLKIEAAGLGAEQLPDPASLLRLPEGLKAYPDQASLTTTFADDRITGTRQQSVAIIASRGGDYDVPEIALPWWNTATDRAERARLPARRLHVQAAANAATDAAPPVLQLAPQPAAPSAAAPATAAEESGTAAPTHARSPWRWISLALAALWLATLGAWAWSARRRRRRAADAGSAAGSGRVDTSAARDAFRFACRSNDARAARRALLDWARGGDAAGSPISLRTLAARTDTRTAALLRELDRCCYTATPWDGTALAAALRELPVAQRATQSPTRLAALYP